MQLYKVGLCAFGLSGQVFHAPFLKEHPGFFLSGIVERSKNISAEKYSESRIYRSVEEMLEKATLDIVVVNTPVQTHYEYVKMALQSGRHVIVEKPFTVNDKEAEELVSLAEEKGLFLSVYQNRRFDRDFLQVKRVIESEVLGELKEVEMRFDRYRPQPSTKRHKEDPAMPGSGAWHDLGAHLIDQMVQLFGAPDRIFGDIFSMKGKAFANDYFEALGIYDSGLRVRLKSSVFVKEDQAAYKIFGANGTLLQDRSDHQEEELRAGAVPDFYKDWVKPLEHADAVLHYTTADGEDVRELLHSPAGDYMNYYRAIYEYLLLGEALPSPAKEILLNMKILDLGLKSYAEQCVLPLPKN